MESPVAAKNIVGGFTAELESDSDLASSTQQQKTERKSRAESTNKEGSGIPVSPKTKYRVGQVINSQNPEDAKPEGKTQTKQHAGDPEPHKEGATQKKKKEPRTSLVETESPRRDMKSSQKKSLENSSQASWPLESAPQGNYEVYEKIMESKGPAESLHELEAENKMLKQFLKDLNEQLKHHVERAKITNYEGKKSEFKDKSAEEQLKTIIKELANNEKILAYNKEEHRKAEARLNVIKDSSYVFGIQKETMNTQAQINMIKKENKQLGLNTGNVGRDLDTIENVKGVPSNIEEAHEREKEAIKLSQKLVTLKQKNATFLEEKKRKLEKDQTLYQKVTKLEKACFGESYVSEDSLNRYQKLAKQAAAAEEDFKYVQKSCQFKINQIARNLEDLYMQQQKEREHVEKLEDVLQEQAAALKDFISNEGSRLNRGAQEVLDQIRFSLELEEKQKGDREKERSMALAKNKSLEAVRALRTDLKMDPVHLNYSSSTKHKNAIRRELEEKKPVWRETNKGERARMEQNFNVPALKIKKEEGGEFSKPSRPVKKEAAGENVPSRNRSVAEEPKEETPKASKKPEVKESEIKKEEKKVKKEVKPTEAKIEEKEEKKEEKPTEVKKVEKKVKKEEKDEKKEEKEEKQEEKPTEVKKVEKKVKKEEKDEKDEKKEDKPTEIKKEEKEEKQTETKKVEKKEKKEEKPAEIKKDEKTEEKPTEIKTEEKKVKKEEKPSEAKKEEKEEKREETKVKKEAKDFFGDLDDIGQLKEEINNYSHQIEKEVENKEKNKGSEKKKPAQKESGNTDIAKEQEHEGKVFELGNKKEKNEADLKPDTSKAKKEKPVDNQEKKEKEGSPAKKEKEGEPKAKEDGKSTPSKTKKQETPKKPEKKGEEKEDEEVREWEDNDNFDNKTKKVSTSSVKKELNEKNAQEDPDFEEFIFDD